MEPAPSKALWEIGKSESKKVNLKFKYYPYYNKIQIWLNVKGLKKAQITGASAGIFKLEGKKTGKKYWNGKLTFKKGIAQSIADIPDLPDGKYRLQIKLEGKNAPETLLIQNFVRKHFEWEHNKLGISDKVIPPFTPMKLKDTTVKCIFRSFTHGDTGLWNKAVSKNKDILTGPMCWDVQTGGRQQTAGQRRRLESPFPQRNGGDRQGGLAGRAAQRQSENSV